jgi:hypothetical protein
MENAICQHILPYYHLSIHLFDQKKVFANLGVAVAEVFMRVQ